jgi:hypothetical protein
LSGRPYARIKEMPDNLYTGVEKAFSAAARHRDVVAKIKKQAKADPKLLAMKVVSVVPECLKSNRAIGLEDFCLDVTDTEERIAAQPGYIPITRG